MHSATGIVYSKTVSRPPLAWADLWTDSYSRRLTMLDDPAEVFGACLKRLGTSRSTPPIRITPGGSRSRHSAKAVAARLPQRRSSRPGDTGDVLVAQMWAQVAQVAMDNSPDLAFSFPSEGFALYADNAAILRESKHKELAYDFLNYLLEAESCGQNRHRRCGQRPPTQPPGRCCRKRSETIPCCIRRANSCTRRMVQSSARTGSTLA